MRVVMQAGQRQRQRRAVTYGPVVLSGNYGNTALVRAARAEHRRRSPGPAPARSRSPRPPTASTVNLGPFYDAHGFNYTVYWNTSGGGGTGSASYRLVNAASGLVLGIQNMSTADGGLALQWGDNGTADHNWEIIVDGTAVRLRNVNSGKVLGVENMSTADNARVLQWADNGTADHRWTVVDNGDGTHKLRNVHSGKLLGILNGSTRGRAGRPGPRQRHRGQPLALRAQRRVEHRRCPPPRAAQAPAAC